MAAKKGFNFLYPLVIAILIILGLTASLIAQNSKNEEIRREVRNKADEVEDLKRQNKDLQKEVWELREFITGDSGTDVATESIRATHFEDWKSLKVQLRKLREETGASAPPDYTYMEEIYTDVKEELIWQAEAIAELRKQRDALQAELDTERAEKAKLRQEKDAQISELDAKLTQEKNARQQDNAQSTERIQTLIDEKAEVSEEMNRMRKDFQIQVAELQSVISDLQDRIESLVKKQQVDLATAEPDGEVIGADVEMLTARVDLGRVHGLTRGLPFQVFQIEKGGQRRLKGRIQIRDVKHDWATAIITEVVDARNPIVNGDFVISPLFSKNEQKTYVFLGEMVNPRFSQAEMIRKIEESGGRVDEKVTVQTDFAVVGKDAEVLPEFEKARQLGIRILREAELLDFLAP